LIHFLPLPFFLLFFFLLLLVLGAASVNVGFGSMSFLSFS
jgi:hypothetical protein